MSTPPFTSAIHKRFREERLRLGWSHQKAADIADGSRGSVIAWEQGTALPAHALEQFAAYGMDVQYVVTGVRTRNLEAVRAMEKDSKEQEAALTAPEWKMLRGYRALSDSQREQASAMLQVLSLGMPIGGANVVIGKGGRTAGRDYHEGAIRKDKKGR